MRWRMLAVLLALAGSSEAAAQVVETSPVTPPTGIVRSWDRLRGARVRISRLGATRLEGATIEGTMISTRADSLFVAVEGQDTAVIVLAEPTTMVEEWRRDDPTKEFVFGGLILGSVMGGVIANVVNDKPAPRTCEASYDTWGAAFGCAIGARIATSVEQSADQIAAILLGVAVGAALGAVGGKSLARSQIKEGWRPVTLRRFGVRPSVQGGIHLGVQLAF
ncbi:MAG TPA: hypothetical protein VLA36_04780 [Longimicrobiales bacterium]|nr:hypothetical protein [Longimicrobiales bacterium]